MFFASAALVACDAKGADLPSQQQAAPAKPAPPAANPCFASLYDFLIADPDDCPLAWNGITALRKVRLRRGLRFARRSLQWQLSQRGRNPDFKEQQRSPLHARAKRARTEPMSESRARSASFRTGRWSSSLRTVSTPTLCSAPTGRNRWSKTTRLRSTRKLRTAIRAGRGSSSTLRPTLDSAIRLTVTCLRGGRTP